MENPSEILAFCLNKGILLDEGVLKLFNGTIDVESAKLVIEKIKTNTQEKIITKNFLENKDKINQIIFSLPKENQQKLEKLKIKLGLSIEISKEEISSVIKMEEEKLQGSLLENPSNVKLISKTHDFKKIEVKNFVNYFRKRFSEMKVILQDHPDLKNLVSINKISGDRRTFSIIGMVCDKKVTKNNNFIFEVEDLTGKVKVLVNNNKVELYKKAEEICLDSVIGFNCSGNQEIVFANDIIFPDSMILERKHSPFEEYALFIGDLHFGSKRFLGDNFKKFIEYLGENSKNPEVDKIKYLFLIGDVITGVGNYPGQEKDLEIGNLEEQYLLLANLLKKIKKDITIIISPGNHDGVRIMEPQPLFDKRYAWPLYDMKNVFLTENPALVNIGAKNGFQGFNVLTYHGFSFPYYANNISRLMLKKSMNTPEEIMKYLLLNRHLAPTHSSTQYFPSDEDALLIKEVPDIFVAGHTHKSAVSYHNNVLIISVSSWEGFTPYQEKFGNKPDHCKVPMFNLKTRAVKILDFE